MDFPPRQFWPHRLTLRHEQRQRVGYEWSRHSLSKSHFGSGLVSGWSVTEVLPFAGKARLPFLSNKSLAGWFQVNLKAIFRQSFGIRQYYKSFRLCPELSGLQAAGHMTLACKALGVIGSWGRLGSYFVWMLFNYDLGVQNHVFSSPLQPVLFILGGCWCSFLLLYCYFNFICSSSKRIKLLVPFLWWLMCTNSFTFELSRQISPFWKRQVWCTGIPVGSPSLCQADVRKRDETKSGNQLPFWLCPNGNHVVLHIVLTILMA